MCVRALDLIRFRESARKARGATEYCKKKFESDGLLRPRSEDKDVQLSTVIKIGCGDGDSFLLVRAYIIDI